MPEIEFQDVAPYTCPTCGKKITFRPCPACVARGKRPDVVTGDGLLLAAERKAERSIDQARHEGASR